ncbi:MAG: hypothetical protein AAF561_15225, partial [Planctomycetota bacterium]
HDDAMANVVRDCSDVVDPLYTVLSQGGPFHCKIDGSSNQPRGGVEAYVQRLRETDRDEAADAVEARYGVPASVAAQPPASA